MEDSIIYLLVLIVAILIFRPFHLWYWQIKKRTDLMEQQNLLLFGFLLKEGIDLDTIKGELKTNGEAAIDSQGDTPDALKEQRKRVMGEQLDKILDPNAFYKYHG